MDIHLGMDRASADNDLHMGLQIDLGGLPKEERDKIIEVLFSRKFAIAQTFKDWLDIITQLEE